MCWERLSVRKVVGRGAYSKTNVSIRALVRRSVVSGGQRPGSPPARPRAGAGAGVRARRRGPCAGRRRRRRAGGAERRARRRSRQTWTGGGVQTAWATGGGADGAASGRAPAPAWKRSGQAPQLGRHRRGGECVWGVRSNKGRTGRETPRTQVRGTRGGRARRGPARRPSMRGVESMVAGPALSWDRRARARTAVVCVGGRVGPAAHGARAAKGVRIRVQRGPRSARAEPKVPGARAPLAGARHGAEARLSRGGELGAAGGARACVRARPPPRARAPRRAPAMRAGGARMQFMLTPDAAARLTGRGRSHTCKARPGSRTTRQTARWRRESGRRRCLRRASCP